MFRKKEEALRVDVADEPEWMGVLTADERSVFDEFPIRDEHPESDLTLSEDKDVSRMREVSSPKDYRMAGVIDKALTDDFATLHAIGVAIDAEPLLDYIESYYRMSASESGRGRNDMVAVGRQAPPQPQTGASRFFRFGRRPEDGQ